MEDSLEVECDWEELLRLPAHLPTPVVEAFAGRSQLDFELEFFTAAVDRNPAFVEALRVLSGILTAKGEARRAWEIDRRLVDLLPNDPDALFQWACSSGRLDRFDEAIDALGRSVAAGFDDFDELLGETAFDGLRNDPRFHALLPIERFDADRLG
ncbi:MAG: TPR end-of-group domain-containing protein [Planctomycetia bacterium]